MGSRTRTESERCPILTSQDLEQALPDRPDGWRRRFVNGWNDRAGHGKRDNFRRRTGGRYHRSWEQQRDVCEWTIEHIVGFRVLIFYDLGQRQKADAEQAAHPEAR